MWCLTGGAPAGTCNCTTQDGSALADRQVIYKNNGGTSKGIKHGRMNYKDTKPYMSAFLSVDLLTDFVAFCSTDFIVWRYIQSWFVFSTQPVNCCPHWRRNYTLHLYCCLSTVPSLWLPSPSPPSQYTDSVWLWVGGCWNVLWTIFCRSFTLCFWPDSEPIKLLHHP